MDSFSSESEGETKKVPIMIHNNTSSNDEDDPFASLVVNTSTLPALSMVYAKDGNGPSDVVDTNDILHENDNTTTVDIKEGLFSMDTAVPPFTSLGEAQVLNDLQIDQEETTEIIERDSNSQTNVMIQDHDETECSEKTNTIQYTNYTQENHQSLPESTTEVLETVSNGAEDAELGVMDDDSLVHVKNKTETVESPTLQANEEQSPSDKSLDTSAKDVEIHSTSNKEKYQSPPVSPSHSQGSQNVFRNRFAMLKSRADAVLQNSEVLKAAQSRADQMLSSPVIRSAQRNIEEKRKEVQKVVEERVLNTRHWQSHHDDPEHKNKTFVQSDENKNGEEISNDGNDRIIADDDISFSTKDSLPSKSIQSDSSSVCADSDDSISVCSDESSVYIPEASKTSTTNTDNQAFIDLDPTPIKRNLRNVVESTYHGRYGDPNRPPKQSREQILNQLSGKVRKPSPPIKRPSDNRSVRHESQTALINRTLSATQFKALIQSLKQGEYVMLLGNGMLGVNLKQTYLNGHGVYVDFVAPGGNAEKSGVICVGDALVRVGDEDVSKGTIFNVPEIIAKTKRPCIIVLNGEHNVEWKDMDYIDVAIGMVNQILTASKSAAGETTFGKAENLSCPDISLIENKMTSSKFTVPRAPGAELRKSMSEFSGKRNNRSASVSALSFSCKEDKQFKHVLREAFLSCCMDSRRLPFFTAFLSNEESFTIQRRDSPSNATSNTKLMLYLELLSFRDVFAVASSQRRLDHVKRIAYKFLVPSEDSSSPSFDLRAIFSSDDLLHLRDKVLSVTEDSVEIDFFQEIEKSIEQSLAGATFASYLLSNECARMRAYMRGTSPFVDAPLDEILSAASDSKCSANDSARNHLSYIILYLLCKVENDTLDKNYIDRSSLEGEGNGNKRLKGAVGAMSCAIYIEKVLLPVIENSNRSEEEYTKQLIEYLEIFWESFLAPFGGILDSSSHSNDTYKSIETVRKTMFMISQLPAKQLRESLVKENMTEKLNTLQNDLVYDYCVNDHPKFRSHTIHEWMCNEFKYVAQDDFNSIQNETFPMLPKGCISRLIRKIEIPHGVSRHSPMHSARLADTSQLEVTRELNADYVVIFCSSQSPNDDTNPPQDNHVNTYDIQTMKRTAFVPLSKYAKKQMKDKTVDQIIPITMESYVMIPPFRQRPFKQSLYHGRKSRDGWEISLVNLMVPHSTGTNSSNSSFLYGVSLVLNKVNVGDDKKPKKEKVIALTLISERCSIPSMRKTLCQLFEDHVVKKPHNGNCADLVTVLETFTDASESQLVEMLGPYIKIGSAEWESKAIMEQDRAFEAASLHVLVESLPPISLSLLFITAILEQKVVFTSSRRSTLVSMVVALRSLLHPLNWSHLIVPTAPSALARDLLQYPAPFLLGIALDNQESMDLLKSIPSDITLVDVDVGRIILAQKFSHHFMTSETDSNGRPISMLLRSQVLHLAELLGNIIGLHQSNSIWRSDSPITSSVVDMISDKEQKVESTQTICHSFLREMISGLNTCCYWIEERGYDGDSECHILFDEDRFLQLKRMRGNGKFTPLFSDLNIEMDVPRMETRAPLALNLEDFNLILETFLRGQGLSTFISSQKKETLAYW